MTTAQWPTPREFSARLARAAVTTAALCCATTTALAASAQDLIGNVTSVPIDAVSSSRDSLTTFVAYRVRVTNRGTSTANTVVFSGQTSVTGVTGYAATYGTSSSILCGGSGPTVTCNLGQIKGLANSGDFVVVFSVPNLPADTTGAGIKFVSSISFSVNDTSGSTNNAIVQPIPDVNTSIVTTDDPQIYKQIGSALPTGLGRFFTGKGQSVSLDGGITQQVLGLPGTSDQHHTTTVAVPSTSALFTNNTITETGALVTVAGCDPSDPKYFCYGLTTQLSIRNAIDDTKATFPAPYLTFTLIQDALSVALKPNTKLKDVRIFYTPDGAISPILLTPCSTTTSGSPSFDVPCVDGRVEFGTKGKNIPSGLEGTRVYIIRAVDNGKFTM